MFADRLRNKTAIEKRVQKIMNEKIEKAQLLRTQSNVSIKLDFKINDKR